MKKSFLISVLLANSLVFANSYDYEISGIVGQEITADDVEIDYHILYGAEIQINRFTDTIHPEMTVFYSSTQFIKEPEEPNVDTDIVRIGLNGVYEYKEFKDRFIPSVKLGFGYKAIHKAENPFYSNLSVGTKIPITEQFSLKGEYSFMMDFEQDGADPVHAFWGGISYAFGDSSTRTSLFSNSKDDEEEQSVNMEDEEVDFNDANDLQQSQQYVAPTPTPITPTLNFSIILI